MVVRILKALLLVPVRVVIFAIGWCDYHLEITADWLVGARALTEYVRRGKCVRCGRCCRLLGIQMPEWVAKKRWLVRMLKVWHSAGLNFEYQGEAGNMLAYRCRYYRDGEGCSIYPIRHRLCRFFPKQHLYGKYELGDDCGFKFIKRDVARRLKARKRKGDKVFGDLLKVEGEERSPL